MGAIRSRDDCGTHESLWWLTTWRQGSSFSSSLLATARLRLGRASGRGGVAGPPRPPAWRFGRDTFAFPNESLTKNRGKPDLYANYCFVMARAVTQFQRFARFDPAQPRLDPRRLRGARPSGGRPPALARSRCPPTRAW